MINGGWVKLHRSIFNSSLWMMGPNDFKVAMALIVKANPKEKEFYDKWERKRILVPRGELITSYAHFAELCGLSIQNVRTSIKNLTHDGFIEIVKPNTQPTLRSRLHFTHIRICKYETYQKNIRDKQNENLESLAQHQQAMNSQFNTTLSSNLTTKEEERSEKKESNPPKSPLKGGQIKAKPQESPIRHRRITRTQLQKIYRSLIGAYAPSDFDSVVVGILMREWGYSENDARQTVYGQVSDG